MRNNRDNKNKKINAELLDTISFERITKETTVSANLNFTGLHANILTPSAMFNHLLTSFAYNCSFSLELSAKGDCEHHMIEDCGIVLGSAFRKFVDSAVKSGKSIARSGFYIMPMDDAVICCVLDIDGRGYFESDLDFIYNTIDSLHSDLIQEFFMAFARNLKASLHFIKIRGKNDHHVAEAAFKAFGKALQKATKIMAENAVNQSTKGLEQWIIKN